MHVKSERIAISSLLGAFVIVRPSGSKPPLGWGKWSTRSFTLLSAPSCRSPAPSTKFDDLAPGLKFLHDARELGLERLQQHFLKPTDGPPGTSRSLQYHVVRLVCGILNCCQNIVTFEIGIILQNLLGRRPGAEEFD
jgi:hypothetical protein